MKWKIVCCLILLAGVILQATPAVAADGTIEVTGTIPLVASDVAATGITQTSATISWKTNGNATSQVFYDTVSHASVADYAYHTTEAPGLVSTHSVTLAGLAEATTYNYRVKSLIPDTDFIAISDNYTFTTSTTSAGCFIATAAYGTPTAVQINILRQFRDKVLLPNKAGAAFVSFYYRTSPPIANFIANHELVRTIVREGFIEPLVAIVRFSQSLWNK